MKANREVELQLSLLTLAPDGVISFTLRQFCPQAKSSRTHWVGLRTSLDIFWRRQKSLAFAQNRTTILQGPARALPIIASLWTLSPSNSRTRNNESCSCNIFGLPMHLLFTCRYGIFNRPSKWWPISRLLLTSIVTNDHACSPYPQLSAYTSSV
jgi:hypothetical protein